jgi:hypothetical protein
MAVEWVKETPAEEGWYWIKYTNKRRKTTVCPCIVYHFKDGGTMVHTAWNDDFMEGPNHGGPGLKYDGKLDKSIRFGPRLPEPD